MPNFATVTLKFGSTAPKISKIGIFWYKSAQKGYTPLSVFFAIFCLGERAPGPHRRAKFHRYSFKNVALRPLQIAKNGNFG